MANHAAAVCSLKPAIATAPTKRDTEATPWPTGGGAGSAGP